MDDFMADTQCFLFPNLEDWRPRTPKTMYFPRLEAQPTLELIMQCPKYQM